MVNMPVISQLPCTSGSFLPSLFQPVAVLLRDTSTGWDKVGALCSCWVGRAGLEPVPPGQSLCWGVQSNALTSVSVPWLLSCVPPPVPTAQGLPGWQSRIVPGWSCRCCLLWEKIKQTEPLPWQPSPRARDSAGPPHPTPRSALERWEHLVHKKEPVTG